MKEESNCNTLAIVVFIKEVSFFSVEDFSLYLGFSQHAIKKKVSIYTYICKLYIYIYIDMMLPRSLTSEK